MKLLKFFEAGIVMSLALFAPVKQVMIASAVLILVDLATGIVASLKNKRPITSAGLRQTLSKLIIYELGIMVAFVAEHYISNIMPFVSMISGMISIVEVKSIYENINEFNGGSLLKSLIDKLGSSNQVP